MAGEPAGPGEPSGGPVIVTACRLNAQKDFGTLLRAFALVREKMASRLLIVGGGELMDEVLAMATDLGIEAYVTITGFQMNPFRFFRGARVFVLSSFFEGFGNVIVEAMTLGLPVVSTDCPSGPAEIIRHGVDGYLVPAGDHVRMAETIMTLLNDDELRRKVGGEGIRRAENFRLETMLRDFRKIIDRCF
jgi:glycosyltransferase involved in cell wall biosynthesis